MNDPTTTAPDGYAPHFRKSPLTDPWEPIYSRFDTGTVQLALHIAPQHCNGRGFAHGGLISALADNAMGLSVVAAASLAADQHEGTVTPQSAVTINLAVDFLGVAQVGDLIEWKPRVLKVGRSVAFVDCIVHANTKLIARANATFRFMQ